MSTPVIPTPKKQRAIETVKVNLGASSGMAPEDYIYPLQKARVNIGGESKGQSPEDFISDPAPFDVDGEFAKWNNSQPIEVRAQNRDNFHVTLEKFTRPFKAQGFNTVAAYNRGMAQLTTHLDLCVQFLERHGLGKRSGFFEKAADIYEKNRNYWRNRAEQNGIGFIDELFSDAAGSAIPSIAEFTLDLKTGLTTAYMAGSQEAYNKKSSALAGGLIHAAETGTLGATFRMISPLKKYLAAPAFGTIGGLQAMQEAPEGEKTKAFVSGFVPMAMYSVFSNGGRLGLNEIQENARSLIETPLDPNLRLAEVKYESPDKLRPALRFGNEVFDGRIGERHIEVFARTKLSEKAAADTITQPKAEMPLEAPAKKSQETTDKSGEMVAPSESTATETTTDPKTYLDRVGADSKSINLRDEDKASVSYFREQIREGNPVKPPEIHLDQDGNVIGADGRHRALAYQLEGVSRIPVKILRRTGEGKGELAGEGKEAFDRYEIPEEAESGFVDFEGNFLLRDEAKSYIERTQPDVFERWVQQSGSADAEFHTRDYQKASDIRERLFDESGFLALPEKPDFENIYQNAVNRFAAIENIEAKAEALGAKIKPGESPKLRSRGYLGMGGKVQSVLKDKTFKIDASGRIQITGEGLKPILDDYQRLSPEPNLKIKEREFNNYFTSVRTIEDLQRPKAEWTLEEIVTQDQVNAARNTLDHLRAKYNGLDHFEAVAQRLYAFQRRVLYSLVDSGNLSFDQYEKIVLANPHYVPFNRVMEEIEGEAGGIPTAKKLFTEARAPVKRIKGSELEIEEIIGSIIKNTYRVMDVAERNTVARTIGRLAAEPDPSVSTALQQLGIAIRRGQKGIPTLGEELGITRVPIPVHAIKVRPEEIDTITRTFRSQTQEVKKEIKQSISAGGPALAATSAPMQKLESIVKDSLKSRGFTEGEASSALEQIKKAAAAKGQPQVPAAGAPTQTQTIETTIDRIIKETVQLIEVPTESKIWRASPYKPKGRIIEYYDNGKKVYIDVPENLYEAMSGMNETSSGLLTKILSLPARLLRTGVTMTPDFMLRNFIRDNQDAFIQSTVGFRPYIDSVAAIADIAGKSDAYYDWLRSGAAHSTFVDLSEVNLKKMVAEIQKDPSAWTYLNVVADAEKISMAMEEATRLGISKAAKRNGKSDIESMWSGREGTVDFGVHGQSKELRTFSSITAFFNPAIQGFDRTIRAHKEHPVSTPLKALATITIPSMILWYINKDDPDYKEMPQWRRDLFWNLKVGDSDSAVTWISIPKPFTLGMVYGSVPERFMDYAYTKDPKAFKDLFSNLIDSATPVSGDPNGALLPTAIKPLVENATNWMFFRERPVIPKAREALLPELQYGKYTTETAKLIGRALGYSPAKIENLITGWTGTTGKYSLDALDLAIQAITGEKKAKRPTDVADYPVIRAFVGRPVESDPESLRDFYDNTKEIEAAYKSFRDSIMKMDMDQANRFMRNHPKLMLYPTLDRIKESISNIDKMIEMISTSSLDSKTKRGAIRGAERMRLSIVQEANKLFEAKKETKDTEFKAKDENKESNAEMLKKASKRFSIREQ